MIVVAFMVLNSRNFAPPPAEPWQNVVTLDTSRLKERSIPTPANLDEFWMAAQTAVGKLASLAALVIDNAFNREFNAQNRPALLAVVFFSLATGSLIIPIPEEVLVATVGFTAWIEAQNSDTGWLVLLAAAPPCCLAVICGDALIWCAGRTMGLAARTRFKFLARAIPAERIAAVESAISRGGGWAVLAARMVPGARICTFFVAGTMRMPLGRFIAFDFLGSLVSVPLCLGLGVLAADERYGAAFVKETCAQAAQWALLAMMVALPGFWVIGKVRRRALATGMEESA